MKIRAAILVQLHAPLEAIPSSLERYSLALAPDRSGLTYTYDARGERTGITALLADVAAAGIRFRDLVTTQSSLEDIFVNLVREQA